MKKLILLFVIPMIWSCKRQNDILPVKADVPIESGKFRTFSSGDGAWDRLGYGIDVTRELSGPNTVSDAPIFDVAQFKTAYPTTKTDVDPTTYGVVELNVGATAVDYMHDFSYTSSFDVSASNPSQKIEGAKKDGDAYFTGSLTQSNTDQNRTSYSNTNSFATYKSLHKVKRLRFTSDVTVEMLLPYLTPDFVNNVATMSAEDLVAKYGTHVLLDISIGGCLKFDYNGAILKETNYTKKIEQSKTGLGIGLLKGVGININTDKTSTEITEASKATTNRSYKLSYYGGTNSGTSITLDKDGNASQTVNLAGWEASVTDRNAALIEIGKALFLYNFISDPIKKAQVKAVIEQHIADSQIKTVSTIPFYRLFNPNTGRHFYTPNNSEAQMLIGLGFSVESSLGGILTTQQAGSVPLYRWFRRQGNLDDHFYTTASSVYGYASEGIVGYVYLNPAQTHLSIPVHKYFYDNWEHFYTTDLNELGTPNSGYIYEGVGFYLL